jgi:hypothetical protein
MSLRIAVTLPPCGGCQTTLTARPKHGPGECVYASSHELKLIGANCPSFARMENSGIGGGPAEAIPMAVLQNKAAKAVAKKKKDKKPAAT